MLLLLSSMLDTLHLAMDLLQKSSFDKKKFILKFTWDNHIKGVVIICLHTSHLKCSDRISIIPISTPN